MDEITIIDEIAAIWPDVDEHPSDELLALVRSGLQSFPTSGELWYLFGLITQLWEREPGFPAAESLAAFQNATTYDPANIEAHEELAYLYDTYFDDFPKAQTHFRQAIELGGGADCYAGLARVLAQMGETQEALTPGVRVPILHLIMLPLSAAKDGYCDPLVHRMNLQGLGVKLHS